MSEPIGGPAAQELARQELSRPEYHRDDPGLPERVLRWIGGRLDRLADGSPVGWAILVVLLVLLGVLAWAAWRAGPVRRAVRLRRDPADPLLPEPAVDHRARATELAAGGRYDEALREWLRAAVAVVEWRGLLEPRPGRTGTELAREAGALLPAAAPALSAAVAAFDEVWFGERPATAEDVRLAHEAADQCATLAVAR